MVSFLFSLQSLEYNLLEYCHFSFDFFAFSVQNTYICKLICRFTDNVIRQRQLNLNIFTPNGQL